MNEQATFVRLADKDKFLLSGATSQPVGQITFTRRILSSPFAENIPLCF
jgi:hypothetical protein